MKHINKIIALSLFSSSALLAAVPNIGDIEKQVKPPKQVTKQKNTELVQIGGVKKYAPIMKDDKSGRTIFVKNFKIENAIHIKEEKLLSLISSYTNKDLTFTQLQEVASLITKEYRDQGYFVARAYIPVQNIKKNNGLIIISIIEGNYGEFKLENSSRVNNSIVQSMIDDAKQRDNVVSTNTLERAMIIINDTPGVVVKSANIKPGKKVGSSDFSIVTNPSKVYTGYVVVDNTGSKYTGKNRVIAGVDFNSPFEIGDKISLSGLVSNGTDLKNGRIAYSVPLMSNGLRGELSYSQTNYSLVNLDGFNDDDYKGSSKTMDMSLNYPIIRTRGENLYSSLVITNKDLKDEFQKNTLTLKNTKSINLGLSYDNNYLAYNKPSQSEMSINFTYGKLNFDGTNDKEGVNTVGNYSKINLDLSNSIAITNTIFLESALKMQYALGDKNLDGSEDFSLGGASGVKLYPSGEYSAENGYLFNIEAKYQLPNINRFSSQIGIFYDYGRAFISNDDNDSITVDSNKSLQDVGLGYYASYRDFFGQVQVAWNTNSDDITSETNRNSKLLFQTGWAF